MVQILGEKQMRAIEQRVTGVRPKVVNQKKQAVRQVVKRVVSANVPPFGSQTIPSRRQSVAQAKRLIAPRRSKAEDKLLGFIKAQNARA